MLVDTFDVRNVVSTTSTGRFSKTIPLVVVDLEPVDIEICGEASIGEKVPLTYFRKERNRDEMHKE